MGKFLTRTGRSTRARVAAAVAVLIVVAVAMWTTADAYYSATTGSPSNTATAAATFQDYPTRVGLNSPRYHMRSNDAVDTTSTYDLADAIGANANPGSLPGPSDGPRAWWRFNGDTSPTVQDSSGSVSTATLTSSTTPGMLQGATSLAATGLTGNALALNGTVDYLAGPAHVIDSSTAYSAAVWVYLTSKAVDHWALALTGANQSVFALGYVAGCDCWRLRTTLNDNAATTAYTASSAALGAAALNTWTNLAVTVSGATVTFYVDGVSKGTVSGGTWAASSNLVAGTVRIDNALAARNFWLGSLDEVQVYQYALTATEVVAIAAHKPVAEWGFNEEQGTTSADLSGNNHPATLGSAAMWSDPGRTSGAISGNGGATDWASAASVLNTQQSFTVSVLVKLDAGTSGQTHGILGQYNNTTNYGSGFILKWGDTGSGYRNFIFMMPSTATNGGAVQANAANTPTVGNWYWLTAVYDDTTNVLKLYVNGTASGTTATQRSPIASAGGFVIGRTAFGSWVDNFDGDIDVVRAYQYAQTAAQVSALAGEWSYFTAGVKGALQGPQQGQTADNAIAYSGSAAGFNDYSFASAPDTFTLECWFKTTTKTGGQIIGFANKLPTVAVPTKSDRMVFMQDDGKLVFAGKVTTGEARTTGTYNDGNWHHLVAEMGAATTTGYAAVSEIAGMRMYVDGVLVASNATTAGAAYGAAAYVRWGGSVISGWTTVTTPTTPQFRGLIDEVAVYNTQLSHQDVLWHYYANH